MLRGLVWPTSEQEHQVVALLRNGFVVQVVDSHSGPVLGFPRQHRVLHATDLRELVVTELADRVITIELGGASEPLRTGFVSHLFNSRISADPTWLPILDYWLKLPGMLRSRLRMLIPDGAYVICFESTQSGQAESAVCFSIESGNLQAILGSDALGFAEKEMNAADLRALVSVRGNRLQFLAAAPADVFAEILRSPHPATELDRARVRDRMRVLHASGGVSTGLFLLRVLGF